MMNKGVTNRARKSWSDWSPRLVADYHFTDNLMGFASLAAVFLCPASGRGGTS